MCNLLDEAGACYAASVLLDESSWSIALAQSFGEVVFDGSVGEFAPSKREVVPCG